LGFPVYAFDRCGSGVSERSCAARPRLAGLLDEVDVVVEHALARCEHDAVHLLGHCFGALVALLYAALHRPARIAGVVLATPALYTKTDVPLSDKIRIVWSVLTRRPAQIPVPLPPEQMSEQPAFIQFVRDDPLALREVPARFLFELRRAQAQLPEAARRLRAPLLVAMAGDDPICDNPRNRRLLEGVSSPVERLEYAGARHVLEFSSRRADFLRDLADWLERRETARCRG
jgi:alpha-beta hydrolase superfamily lysophospholipase